MIELLAAKRGCEHCPEPGAFSPSQIKLFSLSCQRKWAFRHILKIPEPERSFQLLGQEVHKHNERYIAHGTLPPTDTKSGQIAAAGLGELPAPSPLHGVENHLYFKWTNLAFHGYADLIPHNERSVYDYKTTSSYNYALSADSLLTDPQGLIYAMARYLSLPLDDNNVSPIKLVWLYYKTKPPFTTRRVEVSLPIGELFKNFKEHVTPAALAMHAIRKTATSSYDPNTLPGNLGACGAYGGCPYKSQCNLHVKETFGMLFADKLKAKKLEQQAAAAAPSGSLITDLVSPGSARAAATPLPVAPQSFASEIAAMERKDAAAAVQIAQGVVPPDAPAPISLLKPEEPKIKLPHIIVPEPLPKAKRGRPKKVQDTPSLALAPRLDALLGDPLTGGYEDDAAEPPSSPADDVAPSDSRHPQPDGFVLCINTMPMGSAVTMLSEILQPIAQELATHLKVSHYRLAEEASYGRADALLLSAFREAAPSLQGFIFADTHVPDTNAILPHLETQADMVFRGCP